MENNLQMHSPKQGDPASLRGHGEEPIPHLDWQSSFPGADRETWAQHGHISRSLTGKKHNVMQGLCPPARHSLSIVFAYTSALDTH